MKFFSKYYICRNRRTVHIIRMNFCSDVRAHFKHLFKFVIIYFRIKMAFIYIYIYLFKRLNFVFRSGFKIVVRNGRNARRRHQCLDPHLRSYPRTWHRATTPTRLIPFVHTITTTGGRPSPHLGCPPWLRPRFRRRISTNQITIYFSSPINRDPP